MVGQRNEIIRRAIGAAMRGVPIEPEELIEALNEGGWHLVSNVEEEEHLSLTASQLNFVTKCSVDGEVFAVSHAVNRELICDAKAGAVEHIQRKRHMDLLVEIGGSFGLNTGT